MLLPSWMAKQNNWCNTLGHELSAKYFFVCFWFGFPNIIKEKLCLFHLHPISNPFPVRYSACGSTVTLQWHTQCSNTTCHVKGHADITDSITQGEQGRSRLHSWHFKRTTCTFTPSPTLKLPLQGHGYLWADFSMSIFMKNMVLRQTDLSVNFLPVPAFSPGEGSFYTANAYKVRVLTEFRKTGFSILSISSGGHGF